MRLFLLFIFSMFVVGGLSVGDRLARRPAILIGICTVTAAMFYSYRALR